jgi:UDP-N-acetylmuramyl-tripeptide synthetase
LSTLLRTPEHAAEWLRGRVAGSLTTDSRRVRRGDGFIAWPGAATDGRRFVGDAIAAGASACLVEHENAAPFGFNDERVAGYAGLKGATGPIAAAFFAEPSRQLRIAAVTGTNGKTSTAWWLAQSLSRLGRKCGVVGTLGIGEPGALESNGLTTPDPVLLQQQLRRFVDEGFAACALEASSIGIVERRLDATLIEVAIFTNFTQDHLDYHGSMQGYWAAKQQLFSWPGLKAAVLNIDDAKGLELQGLLDGSALDVWTTSCVAPARLRAVDIVQGDGGIAFDVLEGTERHRVSTAVVGQYNVSNLLGVLGALRAQGIALADATTACSGLQPVPGRAETLAQAGLPMVVIDYAHTPDALQKVLQALRPLAASRQGRLWCLFGCGGDRDARKRPLMAAAAEASADRVIVTSDNPRHEDPLAIIADAMPGFSRANAAEVEPDRARAIADVLARAEPVDVVLLAGKGHEDYQDVGGRKVPFSDRQQAASALARRAALRSAGGLAS